MGEKIHLVNKEKDDFLRNLRANRNRINHFYEGRRNLNVFESAKKTKEDLDNKAKAQDIVLKKWTLIILFIFLAVETILVFILAFLQSYELNFYHLEEWNFRILVGSTITQITIMLQVAVKHLFPAKEE